MHQEVAGAMARLAKEQLAGHPPKEYPRCVLCRFHEGIHGATEAADWEWCTKHESDPVKTGRGYQGSSVVSRYREIGCEDFTPNSSNP